MRTFTTEAWGDVTVSVYPATVGVDPWIRLDNVAVQRTPSNAVAGTECSEPGSSGLAPAPAPGSSSSLNVTVPRHARLAGGASGGDALEWATGAVSTGPRTMYLSGIDLRDSTVAMLGFESRLTSVRSRAEVQVSLDGVSWQTLAVVPESDTWHAMAVGLSAFAGQVVQVRFVFDAVAPVAGAEADR